MQDAAWVHCRDSVGSFGVLFAVPGMASFRPHASLQTLLRIGIVLANNGVLDHNRSALVRILVRGE